MARVFTREEFYELVWTKPMTQLAKEFALSDVALHKVCKKHNIPNPPPGWWAKQSSGKPVKRTPLPKNAAGVADRITIADPNLCRESETLALAREIARTAVAENRREELAVASPIIGRTLAKLRKSKPSDKGLLSVDGAGLVRCEISAQSIDRLEIILSRIACSCLAQGFELVAGDKSAQFQSQDETVAFSLTETIRREKHVLTAVERAEEAAWQRKQERTRRNSWETFDYFSRPRFAEWDYIPTGQLSLEFEHFYYFRGGSPRRSFRDAKVQRLENMASDIAVGLAVLAAAKTEERLRREAEQRRTEELRKQREAAARIKYIEERRVSGLSAVLSDLDELDRLRRLIALLMVAQSGALTPRVAALLEWAKNHLATREARMLAGPMEARLEAEQLFGDTDDHGFVAPAWYGR